MPSTLDLNLLPLSRQNGQDQSGMPGLYMVTPPRKPARGRDEDQLILFFTMTGNAPLTAEQQGQILGRLAQTYYKTPGAVTTSLRTTAEAMNQYLLDRNLRSSSSGHQCIGQLALAVLREQRLILGQCGPVHAFLLSGQASRYIFDPQGAGRGLGFTRAISIRYYQADLQPGDLLILAQQFPPAWAAVLEQKIDNQGFESLRRRLMSQAGSDVSAVFIQVQNGTGKLRMLKPKAPIQMAQQPAEGSLPSPERSQPEKSAQPAEGAEPPVIPETQASSQPETAVSDLDTIAPPEAPESVSGTGQEAISPEPGLTSPAEKPPETKETTRSGPVLPPSSPPPPGPQEAQSTPARPDSARRQRGKPDAAKKKPRKPISLPHVSAAPAARTMLKVGGAFNGALGSVAFGLKSFLRRVLPDESLFTMPASSMAFIAVAMALVVATAGGAVYFQRGRTAQYQSYYSQAVKAADSAAGQTNPVEVRTGWETVIDYLDRADIYITPPTSESLALRSQATAALDHLDAIIRLNFQPALALPLGSSIQVTRLVATDHDLFMLNGTNGNVLRAVLTGQGYEIDPNFVCGPNPSVGPIVDIVPMPKGNDQKAALLAMDANANLMYCLIDDLPIANIPAPPQTNWGKPRALTLDSGDLYILDPETNGVWIYRGQGVAKQPHLFFGSQIPPMKDAIDLAVNQDDLYLLHADGHLTTCTYSGLQESPTRCDDPARYSDSRQGRSNGPQILDAQFSQILYTPPPDPSIYLLDSIHQAIYHFSLKLNLQVQYRMKENLSSASATAFTLGPNRSIFMAVGNKVYYASLP